MRIYADFNDQIDGDTDGHAFVLLSCLGTLRDLCAIPARLHDGLPATLYMTDGDQELEVDAIVRWIADVRAIRGGYWVGEFQPSRFRYVPVTNRESISTWFPCSACGTNLANSPLRPEVFLNSSCPNCGELVQAPVAPPF